MNNWKLPLDIPLETPTLGLPVVIYDALLVIVFVVHIVFIYSLLGASFGSVFYNILGITKKSKTHDKLANRFTNFTTISENMGALWGVAPLLIIGVLYTGFFYTAIIKISPHILHIIYGNIFAFLLSYAYKFSWHKLENHKGFHIAIGLGMLVLFYSLPFVFMSMTNLYMQPEYFSTVNNIWEIMFTPLTAVRLLNFFLTAFGFFGAVMIFWATGWNEPEEADVKKLAIDQGKKWIILSTPLNIILFPLVLFAFSPRIGEGIFKSWFVVFPFVVAFILFALVIYLVRNISRESFSRKEGWGILLTLVLAVTIMSVERQGIRVISFAEPMQVQAEATKEYMQNMLVSYQEFKASERNKPLAPEKEEGEKLAATKGCFACHSVEMRLVGPAYKQVAAKYSSADEIIPSIINGSQGKWADVKGAIMTPNKVTPQEARLLAEWVLKQK